MFLLKSEVGEARPAHALLGISGGDLGFSNVVRVIGLCERNFWGRPIFFIVARFGVFALESRVGACV